MKIKYKPMHVYKLHPSDVLDHEYGRPAIFLDFLGQESLVWFSTSTKTDNKEKSFIIIMNGVISYFYNKGLTKINTKYLFGKWHNNKTHKIISLDDNQQKVLIAKFSSLTLQINPYSEIKILKMKIKLLEKQIKQKKVQQDHGI